MDMQLDLEYLAAIVGVVTTALQIAKKLPFLKDRPKMLPYVAMPVGMVTVAAALLLKGVDWSTAQIVGTSLVYGALGGLGACGLYDVGGKKVWAAVEWVILKLPGVKSASR